MKKIRGAQYVLGVCAMTWAYTLVGETHKMRERCDESGQLTQLWPSRK